MTRSRKKPFLTDQQHSKASVQAKRAANRAVRQANKAAIQQEKDELAPNSGKQYRKVLDSWNIRDWVFHCPKDKKAYRK